MASAATPATFFLISKGSFCPTIFEIFTPGVLILRMIIWSPTGSKQNPKTSNPQDTLATLAGAKILISSIYCFPILIISAKIPEAVTSAPAPAPFTISGCLL